MHSDEVSDKTTQQRIDFVREALAGVPRLFALRAGDKLSRASMASSAGDLLALSAALSQLSIEIADIAEALQVGADGRTAN